MLHVSGSLKVALPARPRQGAREGEDGRNPEENQPRKRSAAKFRTVWAPSGDGEKVHACRRPEGQRTDGGQRQRRTQAAGTEPATSNHTAWDGASRNTHPLGWKQSTK